MCTNPMVWINYNVISTKTIGKLINDVNSKYRSQLQRSTGNTVCLYRYTDTPDTTHRKWERRNMVCSKNPLPKLWRLNQKNSKILIYIDLDEMKKKTHTNDYLRLKEAQSSRASPYIYYVKNYKSKRVRLREDYSKSTSKSTHS